jgi:hypothetical protein
MENKERIDFILNEVMDGKPIEQVDIDFILEDFPEKEKILIDGCVFEIIENKNNTITLKPIGHDITQKIIFRPEEKEFIYRYIKDGKIVETK